MTVDGRLFQSITWITETLICNHTVRLIDTLLQILLLKHASVDDVVVVVSDNAA